MDKKDPLKENLMKDYDQFWPVPPEHLSLVDDEVHVWRASLEQPASNLTQLQLLLSDEEVEHARRFAFAKDRQHWMVAHAVLRTLLGRYLGIDPRKLCFTTNDYGKPSILSSSPECSLHFNLSHSGDLALYAFAYQREVGVDVEQMRADIDYEELARHFFSVYESETLHALPAALREEAFFRCWSRKEAYIKARGKGLSIPLDQFDVSLAPHDPAKLLGSREEPHAPERWLLQELWPGTRYAGALAVEGSGWQLRCWQWPD